MPTNTYTPLATITLTGTDTEVVFASIPNTYRDLILVADFVAATTTNAELLVRFNSDSGNNYSQVRMTGNGSSASSGSASGVNGARIGYGPNSSTRSNAVIQIMDYSATDKHKTLLGRTNEPDEVWAVACRWANTAAVTSVSFLYEGVSLGIGSTFSLYGVIA
jgi:hypothetical protein